MFFKTCATLALATAAVAKPIVARAPEELPAYNRRSTEVAKRDGVFGNAGFGGNNNNGFNNFDINGLNNNNNNGFDLINGFDNFRNQDTFLRIDENNVFIQQDRNRQRIVQEKVTQVLIVDQQNDVGRFRDQRNVFRRANFRNNNRERSTVILVVTQVNVVVDNGRGRQEQQQFFAQSALVANRGRRETDTIQIFEARTLIEQDVFNNDRFRDQRRNQGQNFVFPTATGSNRSRQTAGVKIFDRRPTWSSTAEDPAATIGAIWQAELEDEQRNNNNDSDNERNNAAAEIQRSQLQQAEATSTTSAAAESTSTSAAAEATA